MTAWDYLLPKPNTGGYQPKDNGAPAGRPPSGGTASTMPTEGCYHQFGLCGGVKYPELWAGPCRNAVTLSADEASELARFTAHSYINPNDYPALYALVRRLGQDRA